METTVGFRVSCRPLVNNKPPPLKGLNTRIPLIIPINGRGLSTMGLY